ncbi:uncharacterized protein DSM5745_00234 [Aspergillus mulundensis]|uniref:Terpene synthase n=1 Tax=Aspergillus mulundensis TaxID=1810919 RepID=A0A3D8T2Y3_9EURO|nr:hypothetical protein DSM5745_00234 [Aspergillus mulundensis]RDW92912.1 hypothetical protein DSM5745_00234 [Aspergillus mulundensis]
MNLILDIDPSGIHKPNHIIQHPLPWISCFTPRQHILADKVCQEDNDFFLVHWPFKSEKQRQMFLDMDLSRWSTSACANALDSRIQIHARFNTVLFLIDDMIDKMGIVQGQKYINTLIHSVETNTAPSSPDTASQILATLFAQITLADKPKASDLWTALVPFWRAQTESRRDRTRSLDEYLAWRVTDIGHFVTGALGRWAIDASIPPHEEALIRSIDANIGAQVVLVNDLFSWEKELLDAAKMDSEVVNAVGLVMRLENVDAGAAQRMLAIKVKELEDKHVELLDGKMENLSRDSKVYVRFLENMAAGNESWSRGTARYNVVGGQQVRPEVENISFRVFDLEGDKGCDI